MEFFAYDTNHLLDQYIAAKQNSFLTEWTKMFYYGNPKVSNDTTYKTLMKAVSDFRLVPWHLTSPNYALSFPNGKLHLGTKSL
jgi:hypothetical protein